MQLQDAQHQTRVDQNLTSLLAQRDLKLTKQQSEMTQLSIRSLKQEQILKQEVSELRREALEWDGKHQIIAELQEKCLKQERNHEAQFAFVQTLQNELPSLCGRLQ